MHIERIQVEEGFLNGLDVYLTPGLNVIIGARGTGKTSVIELIRFCLDAQAHTQEVNRRSREHALSILGSGQVTITMATDDHKIFVTRTADDDSPRATAVYEKPIVFSQTEIETIGLEPIGRLRLIDSFAGSLADNKSQEKQISANIVSLTSTITSLNKEIEEFEKNTSDIPRIAQELVGIARKEEEVSKTSVALNEATRYLQELMQDLSSKTANESLLEQAKSIVAGWNRDIQKLCELSLPNYFIENELLGNYKERLELVRDYLGKAQNETYEIWHQIQLKKEEINKARLEIESQTRDKRKVVEDLRTGAGEIMRQGQALREKMAKLNSIVQILKEKKEYLAAVISKRNVELDRLDEIRIRRHDVRRSVIARLNESLRPSIRIDLLKNGQQAAFQGAISDLLRGSGLKYNDIVQSIAGLISPRVLLEAIDRFDVDLVADVTSMSRDRAARVLAHLKGTNFSNIGAIEVEDDVTMQLLDGVDYKDIGELSTGQRCTVILPLLLLHASQVLVVDQPEDHIDNAFIAGTLIKSISNRTRDSQFIFATHNPNIPVLGDADNVVHMGSDGKNGFVLNAGPLQDMSIIEAISTVMEGGAEAFSRRHSFYNAYTL